jgi:lipoprotein-releasing system permease protein
VFKLLLIFKYLFKRRLAWVSLAAVAMCTAMVLVVISVMGGWLEMYRATFKSMSGDLIVSRPSLKGFGNYQPMQERIEALDGVTAVLPVIRTAGLINISGRLDDYVGVVGFPFEKVESVFRFERTLWWRQSTELDPSFTPDTPASFGLLPWVTYETITPDDPRVRRYPGMITGSLVVGARKQRDGTVRWPLGLQLNWARLTVVPGGDDLTVSRTITPSTTQFWIVNGSRTQLPQHDRNVYVPFEVIQRDLKMGESSYIDAATGQEVIEPARTTELHIALKPGVDAQTIKPQIEAIVDELALVGDVGDFGGLRVQTWQEQQALWLGAIENEIALTTFLFALISLVAVFLIFCIFYMIVIEKTRDIGIIKSVGASGWDVAQIFLGYGAAIGVAGGAAGVLLGWLIVNNINLLHTKVADVLGFEIWNSNVYAFDYIPDRINPNAAIVIYAVAVLSAVLGAIVPAVRAAMLRPVAALRFE